VAGGHHRDDRQIQSWRVGARVKVQQKSGRLQRGEQRVQWMMRQVYRQLR